jgi:hypothetical protein
MREIVFDEYDENRRTIHDSMDDDGEWITITDDEYEICRKEELRMIRDYYDKLVELFTMI